jgi:hypothetical protein
MNNLGAKNIASDEDLIERARRNLRPPVPPAAGLGIGGAAAIAGAAVLYAVVENRKVSKRTGEPELTETAEITESAENTETDVPVANEAILAEALNLAADLQLATDLNKETLDAKMQTTLSNIMRNADGNKLKVMLGDAIFIQDPSQPHNGIVSESAYFLRISAGLPSAETQEFFDGLLRGFDMMTKLGVDDGDDRDVFPAWTVKIENGRLVLNTERDPHAYNSASDADHDLVMALLVAVNNVRQGGWKDNGYAERLEGLIDSLADEYVQLGERFVLKPSEDYNDGVFRLDYLSPETCFALAQYLADKDDSRAGSWEKRGRDSLEIYAACLEQVGYVPELAYLDVEQNGGMRITPRGLQGWDGIRAPQRIATGLPYYNLNETQREIFVSYLKKWNDPNGKVANMAPALTAAAYLPLALQLGEAETAAELLVVLSKENSDTVYANQDQYYETSFILKSLVEIRAPYAPGVVRKIKPNPGSAWRLEDVCDTQGGYYGQIGIGFGAYGFVINPDPPAQFKKYQNGSYLITAESLVSGLADAIEKNDKARFQAIFNTIDALCVKNYNEGEAKRLFLPRLVVVKPRNDARQLSFEEDFSIPGGNDGKASNSGVDLILLTLLIKALDLGLYTGAVNVPFEIIHNSQARIRNFIFRYAGEIINRDGDIYPYQDETGAWRMLLTSGGLTGAYTSQTDESLIYECQTDYVQNLDFLRVLARYFDPAWRWLHNSGEVLPRVGNKYGSPELHTVFTALLADTEKLKETIEAKFPQGVPQTVYIKLPRSAGRPLEALDINEFNKEMNQKIEEVEIEINGINGRDYRYYFNSKPLIDSIRVDAFANVNEDLVYNKQSYTVPLNHFTRHWGLPSPLHDGRLKNDAVSGRGGLQIDDSNAYDSVFSIFGKTALYRAHLRAALRRLSEADYAPQGEQMYTNTLLEYAMLPAKKMKNTERVDGITMAATDKFLEFILAPIFADETRGIVRKKLSIEASGVDVVSDYLLLLNAMFGYSKKEQLHRINLLLTEIENYARIKQTKVDPDNPVVKTLRLQQLLLWNDMSPSEREHLDPKILEDYGLDELYAYFKDQPVTQNDWRELKINWNGKSIDLGDYAFTHVELRRLPIPQQLRDMLFRELAKRDVLQIVEKSKSEKQLEDDLLKYYNSLPAEYKAVALIPILYSEGKLREDGTREMDPIPRNIKETFIRKRLEEIDYKKTNSTAEQNALLKTYAAEYDTLWQTYELIIYKEVSKEIGEWVKKSRLDKENKPDAATLDAIKRKLADLIKMMDIVLPTGLNLAAGNADNLIVEFVEARAAHPDAFEKFADPDSQLRMKADILNYLYWLGYDLEKLGDSAAGGSFRNIVARDLRNACKREHSNWETNDKFRGVDLRLTIQENVEGNARITQEQLSTHLRNLWRHQTTAKDWGNKQEYAYFLLTEAFIYTFSGYDLSADEWHEKIESGYSRYEAIRKDEILKQFDYMLDGIENMEPDVYRRNPPSNVNKTEVESAEQTTNRAVDDILYGFGI